MEDKSLIYKETLDDKLGGVLKYESEFGKLSKKETVKRLPLILILIVLMSVIFLNLDADIRFSIVLIAVTAVVSFFVVTLLTKTVIKRNIISTYVTVYQYRTDAADTKKITLKENGTELLSPYSKAFLPYGDIETLISDRLNFIIKIKDEDRISVVPKSGQNPQLLFDFDNIFKEKLADRFIYEM